MSLVHGLAGPEDLFSKLERERQAIESAVKTNSDVQLSDAIFNFSVSAYHLRDWIDALNLVPPQDLLSLFATHQELQACRDIANSAKHFQIERYSPTTQDVYVSATAASYVPGIGGRVKIRMLDGRKFEVCDWADTSIGAWRAFMTEHKILK